MKRWDCCSDDFVSVMDDVQCLEFENGSQLTLCVVCCNVFKVCLVWHLGFCLCLPAGSLDMHSVGLLTPE